MEGKEAEGQLLHALRNEASGRRRFLPPVRNEGLSEPLGIPAGQDGADCGLKGETGMKRHNLIKSHMKNWISLLLAMALICGAAAGCGTSGGTAAKAKTEESRASETAGSEEKAEEKTEMLSQTAAQAKNAADEAAQMQAQAQQVSDLIDGIGEITPGSGPELDEARIAYDALPENVRALVNNYGLLEDAEASYQEATSAVTASEDAISGLGEITADSRDAMDAAWDLYNALPESSREYVENFSDLETAEDTYKTRVEEQALTDIQALIDAGEYQQAMDDGEAFLEDHEVSDESAFQELIDSAHLGLIWQAYDANYLEYTQNELDSLRDTTESETVLAGIDYLQGKLDGWLAYIQPDNRHIFEDTTGNGYGELTVKAGDKPLYVRIERVGDSGSYLTFYVRADSEATIHSLEDGEYYVIYATGDTWYGESELFGNETAAYQTDSNISFTTSYYSTYIEYSIVTLTLYAVADGNLTKSPVDPGKVKGH